MAATNPSATAPGAKSPLGTWLGCGCASFFTVVVAVVVLLSWIAYRSSERFKDELRDPAARAERTQEILPHDRLPAGLNPLGGFSVPFVMEMTMLSDRNPAPGETVDEADAFQRRGLVYMKIRPFGDQQEEVRDYFEGRSGSTELFDEANLPVRVEQSLGRGALSAGGGRVLYVADRGQVGLGERWLDARVIRFLVRCSDESRLRVGIWFEGLDEAEEASSPDGPSTPLEASPEPEPTSQEGASESPQTPTPGDGAPAEAELQAFFDHFDFCA